MRDAEPLVQQWIENYIDAHDREPSNREVDEAADEIIATLTADKSRYHYTNLRPVWNPDGKTWRLEHLQQRS